MIFKVTLGDDLHYSQLEGEKPMDVVLCGEVFTRQVWKLWSCVLFTLYWLKGGHTVASNGNVVPG